ncbi:unnamed protein product [Arabidopsis lyrata]|nr:unnamed protein product [Arabidopsis lyrata]
MIITSLIILHTIPSITSISPDAPTMILIDGICLNTVNAYYCERSIISKLDKPHAEITTITKIAAFNALYISKITSALIRDSFLPRANNPLTKTKLRTCLATYNGLERYLEGAYISHGSYRGCNLESVAISLRTHELPRTKSVGIASWL